MAVRPTTPDTPAPAAGNEATTLPGSGPLAPDQSQSGSASSPSSVPESNGAANEPDYFRALFNNMRGVPQESPAVAEATPVENGKEPEGAQQQQPTTPVRPSAEGGQSPAQSDTVTLTRSEIDRMVQSETDRRLAKQQRDERMRRETEEERELRRTNPYEYAKRVDEREAREAEERQTAEELVTFARTQVQSYDDAVLTPLFLRLPAEEQQRILSSIEEGIPGRGKAAHEAFAVLERVAFNKGVEQARKTLLEDQVFIKEVLARYGGQGFEPESIPAVGTSVQPGNVNDALRAMANPILGRRRGY